MPILAIALLIAGLFLAFWVVKNLIGFLLMLLIAGLIGYGAEQLIPGRQLPYGKVGAIGAGLVGSFLGTMLLGKMAPVLFGVPLIPAMVGALLLVLAVAMFQRMAAR